MRELSWSARSLDDRRAIYSYIERDNPRAAQAMDALFEEAIERLRDFRTAAVQAGRRGRESSSLPARPI